MAEPGLGHGTHPSHLPPSRLRYSSLATHHLPLKTELWSRSERSRYSFRAGRQTPEGAFPLCWEGKGGAVREHTLGPADRCSPGTLTPGCPWASGAPRWRWRGGRWAEMDTWETCPWDEWRRVGGKDCQHPVACWTSRRALVGSQPVCEGALGEGWLPHMVLE